ncbi:DNA-binding response regulator, NarL/FixJ family, contains REC and HTH domains [Thermomonospora echinospora]|uniref:DNA-binding response regulator, NarL/FixJ family, contains REC and HTH domains n=1 Tax=Thermomonospora echinospora TaxID=1992 RepID=A0A1H6DVF0_9ACTN|nr:response regulator transcription factor [Thermomonospora echinospora]SEG88723.1 DNA-binding response regulator, NarL/FixJ family, contains REC and HTH domains [Thermomonospora echinospora]
MTRLLLVDDQQLTRSGLIRIFDGEPDLEVVGECADGDEVERAAVRHRPDVVLMDVRMRRMDGAEATRLLQRRPGAPAVLILTMFDDPDVVAAALTAGAAGFVLKDAPGEEIIQATRAVAAGKGWLDPAVVPQIFDAYRSDLRPRQAETALVVELSRREREVLSLIGVGATNAEIAARLNIAEGTVKTHIGHIFTKLELRDRAAAVIFALRHGLAG